MAAYEKAGESDEWYTPKFIFDALGLKFDVDVASPEEGPRHVPARDFISSNSLEQRWSGLIWMNPPFGHQATKRAWLNRFFEHGNGIGLVPDRTSAPWFQEMAPRADLMCFLNGKVKFERPDGSIGKSPGTGTVLISSGTVATDALRNSGLGFCVIEVKGK